jgi:oxygen-independent coproporphyrinogen-3 oxidase
VRAPETFIDRVRRGRDPESGGEVLDGATRAEEVLTLCLRTRTGAEIPASALAEARALRTEGLLDLEAGRAVLTRRGRLLATEVTARLLLAGAAQDQHVLAAGATSTRYD